MERKKITKAEFSSKTVAQMAPGDSIVVVCSDEREVQNVRLIAAQYKRLKRPEGILRYASTDTIKDDNVHELVLVAVQA